MNQRQLKGLHLGVYRIFWEGDGEDGGGSSVAAIGKDGNGRYWHAPSNWVVVPCYDWKDVKRLSLIETQHVHRMSEALIACDVVNAWGQKVPCCECGEDYPKADLMRGNVFCKKCRKEDKSCTRPTEPSA